jgi:hypothetical protein
MTGETDLQKLLATMTPELMPGVHVLAVERGADPSPAIELPPAVKHHLGLDGKRSWMMLDEGNRFA